jgi:hypothetical protein
MIEVHDTYFKDFGDKVNYISGRPIPKHTDGVCREYRFINCIFHPGCCIPYEDCELVNCTGTPNRKIG